MGYATAYEVWVSPFLREAPLFSWTLAFWFALQLCFTRLLPRCTPRWTRLSIEQKADLFVRCCSIVNGAIMTGFAVLFLCNLRRNQWQFSDDFYASLPYYRYGRVSILAYFVWDIFVCFYYRWSTVWKVHALASLLGTYILSFPFSENYCVFYTGCFELSNIFLHVATIARTLAGATESKAVTLHPSASHRESKKEGGEEEMTLQDRLQSLATVSDLTRRLNRIAAGCEYIFAFLFLVIRVVFGTYVAASWLYRMSHIFYAGLHQYVVLGVNTMVHDEVAVVLSVITVLTVQALQYVWFVEIVKRALGWPVEEKSVEQEGKTKRA